VVPTSGADEDTALHAAGTHAAGLCERVQYDEAALIEENFKGQGVQIDGREI